MIVIKNEFINAVISPKGAELQSLISLETGIEYMWSGDPAFWAKKSPVLFPIVGSLKNDTYYYNQQPYHLPRHGFARDKVFEAAKLNDSEAIFTLADSPETHSNYPFEFTLALRYRLEGRSISCTYEVFNPGDKALLFSVGGHPAFTVPLTVDTVYADYYLEWNKTEALQQWKLDNGLIAAPRPLQVENNRLQLTPALFYKDAIVIKHMQSTCISLKSNKHPHGLNFYFDDFPFFGIWAAKDAAFVCLEPWCGIADSIDHDQQLEHKEGIQHLAPGEKWERRWTAECF